MYSIFSGVLGLPYRLASLLIIVTMRIVKTDEVFNGLIHWKSGSDTFSL